MEALLLYCRGLRLGSEAAYGPPAWRALLAVLGEPKKGRSKNWTRPPRGDPPPQKAKNSCPGVGEFENGDSKKPTLPPVGDPPTSGADHRHAVRG